MSLLWKGVGCLIFFISFVASLASKVSGSNGPRHVTTAVRSWAVRQRPVWLFLKQFVFLAFGSCNPLGFCDSPRMGQQKSSPGQSAAPPWVRCPPTRDCPEGAKLVGIGRMYRRVCSAPSGQRALRAVAFPRRRFALPLAKMFKPVGLKTQERNTAHNSIHSSFSMH